MQTDYENEFTKRYDDLKFTDNFMFCKVMESNPDLCRQMLELILDKSIAKVEFLQKEKGVNHFSRGIDITTL